MLSAVFLNCWCKLNRFVELLVERESKQFFLNIYLIVYFAAMVDKAIKEFVINQTSQTWLIESCR